LDLDTSFQKYLALEEQVITVVESKRYGIGDLKKRSKPGRNDGMELPD